MEQERVKAAVEKAGNYVDRLTIGSIENVPRKMVPSQHRFFTWDNEKRTPPNKTLLFNYSYFTGVVMEGVYDIYEANPEEGRVDRKSVV